MKQSIEPETGHIPAEDWATIVRNVPIPAVDLVVLYDGDVLLGKRANKPAKGEWFVPGGRIRKGETLEEAVHRVADEELGVEVKIKECLGTTEHLYEESDIPDTNGKHYVVTAFLVTITELTPTPDDQHEDLQVFRKLPDNPHPYTEQYFEQVSKRGIFKFLGVRGRDIDNSKLKEVTECSSQLPQTNNRKTPLPRFGRTRKKSLAEPS